MVIIDNLWKRGSKTVLTFLWQAVKCSKLDGPVPVDYGAVGMS